MTTCTGSQRTNHPKDRPAPDTRVLQLPQSPPAAPDLEPVQDEYERAALVWAKEFGYEGQRLPKGQRFGGNCVLAKATGMTVGPLEATDYRVEPSYPGCEWPRYTLPLLVREFVKRFDGRKYPHLDLDRQGE